MSEAQALRQRLDKWLWHVRLQPTRTKAASLVRDGHVRLNGQRIIDPAKGVRAGDVLTLAFHGGTRVVRVEMLLPHRTGADLAVTAYTEIAAL